MKTARELFEELGYELNTYSDCLDYCKVEKGKHIAWTKDICFYPYNKSYSIICTADRVDIDMQTNKAIHRQLEELGWL